MILLLIAFLSLIFISLVVTYFVIKPRKKQPVKKPILKADTPGKTIGIMPGSNPILNYKAFQCNFPYTFFDIPYVSFTAPQNRFEQVVYNDPSCTDPIPLNTIINQPFYYSEDLRRSTDNIANLMVKGDIGSVDLHNFIYCQMFGPLTCYVSSSKTPPSLPFPTLTSPANLIDMYIYRQNQSFYLYTDATSFNPLYIHAYNSKTNKTSTYILKKNSSVLPDGTTTSLVTLSAIDAISSNAVIVNTPRQAGYLFTDCTYIYIGPELPLKPACTPQCSGVCGGPDGCGSTCPNTLISSGNTFVYVNGLYTITQLINYFSSSTNTGTLQGKNFNFVTSLNSYGNIKVDITGNAPSYAIADTYVFDKNTNTYTNGRGAFFVPISCVIGNVVRNSFISHDPAQYNFTYIDSNDNSITKIPVYKELNPYNPTGIRAILDDYKVPQCMISGALSSNVFQYKATPDRLVYFELLGALECSFTYTPGNPWKSDLDPTNVIFTNLTTPGPSDRGLKAATNTGSVSVIPLVKGRSMFFYVAANSATFMLYVYNYATSSVVPYYLILGTSAFYVYSEIDNRYLNFYYGSGNNQVGEWNLSPIVRYASRLIIGPERGNLRGYSNQFNNLITQNSDSRNYAEYTVFDTKTGKSTKYNLYGDPGKKQRICPIPNKIDSIFGTTGTFGLFTDNSIPTMFKGLILGQNSYLFLSIIGNQILSLLPPDDNDVFPKGRFNLPGVNVIKADDYNIAIQIIPSLEITAYIKDYATGVLLKYKISQLSTQTANIKTNILAKAVNTFKRSELFSGIINQFVIIAPPILSNIWQTNNTYSKFTQVVPSAAQLADLIKIDNCPINPATPLLPSITDYRSPYISPYKPGAVPLYVYIDKRNDDQRRYDTLLEIMTAMYKYDPQCPNGSISTIRPGSNIKNTCTVSTCPTLPDCVGCTKYLGGINSCGQPCKNLFITDKAVDLPSGPQQPLWQLTVTPNTTLNKTYSIIVNTDGSFGLKSGDTTVNFLLLKDKKVIIILDPIQLTQDYYLSRYSTLYFNHVNNRYEFLGNPSIYISPITTPTNITPAEGLSYNNDQQNCGFYGHTCPPGEICCGQKCVPNTNTGKCYNICKNGYINCNGTCISSDNTYSDCSCKKPLSGDTCSIECNNHGRKNQHGTCTCQTGFTGDTCQYPVIDCGANGHMGADGKCVCTPGFKGTVCQYSDSITCNNHGTVSDTGICTCIGSYNGPNCQYSNAQCNNQGTYDGTSCKCWIGTGIPQYGGPTCSIKYGDYCQSVAAIGFKNDNMLESNTPNCACLGSFGGQKCTDFPADAKIWMFIKQYLQSYGQSRPSLVSNATITSSDVGMFFSVMASHTTNDYPDEYYSRNSKNLFIYCASDKVTIQNISDNFSSGSYVFSNNFIRLTNGIFGNPSISFDLYYQGRKQRSCSLTMPSGATDFTQNNLPLNSFVTLKKNDEYQASFCILSLDMIV